MSFIPYHKKISRLLRERTLQFTSHMQLIFILNYSFVWSFAYFFTFHLSFLYLSRDLAAINDLNNIKLDDCILFSYLKFHIQGVPNRFIHNIILNANLLYI